jgi:hypothetical protein
MLLHSTPAAAMMPATMSEQTEPPERTANEPPERLTFAEAAERLNITADAVRMRVHRGKLASIQVNDRTFVLWPQPAATEQANEPRTVRTGSEHRSAVQGNERLIAALQSEVAYLRSALDTEMEARRRADHLVAGLMERLPELAASTETPDSPQDLAVATVRDAAGVKASETLIDRLRHLIGRG